ncbi:MAG: FecR family protein, partial [Verrucomicrobiaceae bacterium]|nr:FecR family protein [Verrucomicrobiaceae bacterium]
MASTPARAIAQTPETPGAELLTKENVVDYSPPAGGWAPAIVGQSLAVRDRLRTGEDSRAAVRLADASVLRIDELTETEILPPKDATSSATLNLKQGTTYFFSREKGREVQV